MADMYGIPLSAQDRLAATPKGSADFPAAQQNVDNLKAWKAKQMAVPSSAQTSVNTEMQQRDAAKALLAKSQPQGAAPQPAAGGAAPVMPQMIAPQELKAPQISTRGIRETQKKYKQAGEQFSQAQDTYTAKAGELLTMQQGLIDEDRMYRNQALTQQLDAKEKLFEAQQETAATVADIEQKKSDYIQDFENKQARLQSYAKYSSLEPEEVDSLEALVSARDADGNNLYSEEQRAAAQAKLSRAEGVGDKRSMGTKIGAAIAMALGALGSAMAKTPNYAMNIINQGIERDIAEQRDKRASKRGDIRASKSDFARGMKVFGDEKQAALYAKQQAYERVQLEMDKIATKAGGRIDDVQRQQMQVQLDQKKQDTALEMEKMKMTGAEKAAAKGMQSEGMLADVRAKNISYDQQADAMNTQRQQLAMQAQQQQQSKKAGADLPTNFAWSDEAIKTGRKLDTEAKKDVYKTAKNYAALNSQINKVEEIMNSPGWAKMPGSDKKAKLKALNTSMQFLVKDVKELGQLTEGDMAMIKTYLADPTDMSEVNFKAKWDTMKESLKAETQARIGVYGVQLKPGQR